MEENHDSAWKNLIQKYKNLLKEHQNVAFDGEAYKWEVITSCQNKTWQETLLYFAKESINLFDHTALNNAKKMVVDSSYNQVFENLFDENISLDNRLANYKEKMFSVSPNYKFNDERSASVFLTCHNPEKYTFYKDSYYKSLCNYLEIKTKPAGEKYSHYLNLIEELESFINEDSELVQKFAELTKDYVQSTKLIAQNIIYVCFDNGTKFVNLNGDPKMSTTSNSLTEKLKTLLLHTHNLILHGAPGTGKTHLAHEIAKSMNAETEFVQFHPSYDYTDFVEGLRPKNDANGNIGFEHKDGVFKEFCKKAFEAQNVSSVVDNFEEVWNKMVDHLNENDFIDVPLLSGKDSFRVELNEYGDGLANRTYENDEYKKGDWIQGKSKFFNKDQLYNIYKGLPGIPSRGHDNYRKAIIEYCKKNFGLKDYSVVENAKNVDPKTFLFIIDEINRGELSKIFGELFYAIDPGYRGEKGRIQTQYQNLVEESDVFKKGFFVPENVYIIGTMNDIDRSVDTMDFAFRRRFTFYEIKAEDTIEMLDEKTDENGNKTGLSAEIADEAKTRMTNLNYAISAIEGLNSSYHIGGAYFLKLNELGGDFNALWNYHLEGLLREYLRGRDDAEEELDKLKAAYHTKDYRVKPDNDTNDKVGNRPVETTDDSESADN